MMQRQGLYRDQKLASLGVTQRVHEALYLNWPRSFDRIASHSADFDGLQEYPVRLVQHVRSFCQTAKSRVDRHRDLPTSHYDTPGCGFCFYRTETGNRPEMDSSHPLPKAFNEK
jgi:hypothetical protein